MRALGITYDAFLFGANRISTQLSYDPTGTDYYYYIQGIRPVDAVVAQPRAAPYPRPDRKYTRSLVNCLLAPVFRTAET